MGIAVDHQSRVHKRLDGATRTALLWQRLSAYTCDLPRGRSDSIALTMPLSWELAGYYTALLSHVNAFSSIAHAVAQSETGTANRRIIDQSAKRAGPLL
jgi:hypothetical protein